MAGLRDTPRERRDGGGFHPTTDQQQKPLISAMPVRLLILPLCPGSMMTALPHLTPGRRSPAPEQHRVRPFWNMMA